MKKLLIISLLLIPILSFSQGKRIFSSKELKKADWYISNNDTIIYYLLIEETKKIGDDSYIIYEEISMTYEDSTRNDWWCQQWIIDDGYELLHGPQKHYNKQNYLDVINYYDYGEKQEIWTSFHYYTTGEIYRIGKNYKDSASFGNYHPNGILWSKHNEIDGKLMNISEYYNNKGEALEIGSLKDGTGSHFCYDNENNKTGEVVFKKGKRLKKKSTCSCDCY
jgi:hypothetical protein